MAECTRRADEITAEPLTLLSFFSVMLYLRAFLHSFKVYGGVHDGAYSVSRALVPVYPDLPAEKISVADRLFEKEKKLYFLFFLLFVFAASFGAFFVLVRYDETDRYFLADSFLKSPFFCSFGEHSLGLGVFAYSGFCVIYCLSRRVLRFCACCRIGIRLHKVRFLRVSAGCFGVCA